MHCAEMDPCADTVSDSQPHTILCHATRWKQNFGSHIAEDVGYKYFAEKIERYERYQGYQGSIKHLRPFDENICKSFTNLRCATCFAMAISPSVSEKVFSFALEACHESEIFQVFVAVDSYYKGRGNSQKFKMLKDLAPLTLAEPPTELQSSGVFEQNNWLIKKIHAGQSDIVLQRFYWLQEWEISRQRLSDFLQNEITPSTHDAFQELMQICATDPYALHHLDISDLKQHALALGLPLLDENNWSAFYNKVKKSLPYDPNKADIVAFCESIAPISFCGQMPEEIQSYCTLLVDKTWNLFDSLNIHVTPELWNCCVGLLRSQHPWINCAFTYSYDWIETVFKYKERPFESAFSLYESASSIKPFDYYTQHHAPYIFQKHAEVVDNLCQLLKTHCSATEESICENMQTDTHYYNAVQQYALAYRNHTLETLFTLRCTILWKIAQKQNVSTQLSHLHSTCSQAEKKALAFTAQFNDILDDTEFPGKTIFLKASTSHPLKDLSRLSLTHLM